MCKDFVLITNKAKTSFECIGDIFIRKQNENEHVVSIADAEIAHRNALNRCSYVRFRKRVHEIIM